MPKLRTVLSVMVCSVIAGPTLGAPKSYDGAYSGERALFWTNGETQSCVAQGNVTVTIAGSTLKFTTSDWRNVRIRFAPRSDGSFWGSLEDPTGHVVDVRGEATGTALDADVFNYRTGCAYHWHLNKNG